MRFVDRAILLLLAAVFLFSGVDKIVHYEGFVNALRDYVIVPRGWAVVLAPPVVIVELLVGAALLVKAWRQAAALTAAGVLALFTAALGFNRWLGGRGICGCWFTLTLSKSTPLHVTQNLMLLGLALMTWWGERSRDAASPDPHSGSPEPIPLGLVGHDPSTPERRNG
ncbi:MAG TPA: MauE/DoxX family redox-associated membrane protein [Thermoanaerobaculia bacterium]|jgi:uncharacterized membrane protein|nr:MauE/DoxX family redox-associated membrane protein [Thermoanaerobaculia bacterium]